MHSLSSLFPLTATYRNTAKWKSRKEETHKLPKLKGKIGFISPRPKPAGLRATGWQLAGGCDWSCVMLRFMILVSEVLAAHKPWPGPLRAPPTWAEKTRGDTQQSHGYWFLTPPLSNTSSLYTGKQPLNHQLQLELEMPSWSLRSQWQKRLYNRRVADNYFAEEHAPSQAGTGISKMCSFYS